MALSSPMSGSALSSVFSKSVHVEDRQPTSYAIEFLALNIPKRCRLPVNGTLSLSIKLGSLVLSTKELRVPPDRSRRDVEVQINQLLHAQLDKVVPPCRVSVRVSVSMHGKVYHKTIATEKVLAPRAEEIDAHNTPETEHVVFAGLQGATLRWRCSAHCMKTEIKLLSTPPRSRLSSLSSDGLLTSDKLETVSQDRGTAEKAGHSTTGIIQASPAKQHMEAPTTDSDLSEDSLQVQCPVQGAQDLSRARGDHDHHTPRTGEPRSCTTAESDPNPDILASNDEHPCEDCRRNEEKVRALQRSLRRCHLQLRVVDQDRQREGLQRHHTKLQVEQHVHELFVQCERLKGDNAYLLKGLIAAKMELAEAKQALDMARGQRARVAPPAKKKYLKVGF